MTTKRSGFSLIELMVVIALVSLLAAILSSASFWVIGYAREAATKSTILILSAIIDERTKAMEAAFNRNPTKDRGFLYAMYELERDSIDQQTSLSTQQKSDYKNRLEACRNSAIARLDSIGTDGQFDKIIVHREYQRAFFPQNWDDAEFMLIKARQPQVDSSRRKDNENAEVLYWMITSGYAVGSQTIDADSIPTSSIRDTDGNGLKEILDAWGKPIQYIRWPARLLRSSGMPSTYTTAPAITDADMNVAKSMYGSSPSDALHSTDDPLDLIGLSSGKAPSVIEGAYFLPATYCRQIVFSGGVDGETGIENPKSGTGYWGNPKDASLVWDNITSSNVSAAVK